MERTWCFLVALTKDLTNQCEGRKGLLWLTVSERLQPMPQQGSWRWVAQCSQKQGEMNTGAWLASTFPASIQSRTLAHKRLLLIFRVGLQFRFSRNSLVPDSTSPSVAMVRKGFMSSYTCRSQPIIEGSQGRHSFRILKKKLWKNDDPATGSSLANLLKHPRTTCPW